MKNKHIAVLMGGWHSEREVSIKSGEAVYESLIRLGYRATKINFDRKIVSKLDEVNPDIVFNALHGHFGEDGRVQGLLDILNIPYTHSDLAASAISMNKILTHEICSTFDIKAPKSSLITKGENDDNQEIIEKIGKSFVIKPINEGSSVGVQIFLEGTEFDIKNFDWKYGDQMIVEKYISGQEINVAIMDNRALGAIEVRPKNLFYDYECKYTEGMTDYIMPAEIDADKYQEALDLALKCHKAMGCSGISRVEFILNNKNGGDNQFYFLEINTHPGFTSNSLVPKIADYCGISFDDIVEYLVSSAKCGI
ncbi:MAG: D-alanine-D-alanine ligase [Rickettsiales bacterium]|jgi:D-alanine-D-alanine ligase